MPLQLINFFVQQNEQRIILKWQTENEVNTKAFVIETSEDSKIFTSENTIVAFENGNHFYSYELPATATKYVRLRMVDKDGKYCYSNIIKLSHSAPKGIIINHPINSRVLQINVNSILYSNTPVYIYDTNGNLLKQFIINQGLQTIDISSLRSSVIYIKTQVGVITTLLK